MSKRCLGYRPTEAFRLGYGILVRLFEGARRAAGVHTEPGFGLKS